MRSPEDFMRRAIELSKLGYPAPNPRVGAVLVKDGEVIGEGHHESAGTPHAEIKSMHRADAKGAELYVTLEPCAHYGRTPPCSKAIIEAGIKKVVFAVDDPNTVAAGGGKELLDAGVEVQRGMLAEEAEAVNKIFLHRYRKGSPYVLAKAAITLDGRIATKTGQSKWITDETARRRAHRLRAEFGCVLVGSGTASKDDPSLLSEDNRMTRVVLDYFRDLSDSLKIFSDGKAETLRAVYFESAIEGDLSCESADGELDLRFLLDMLAKRGIIGVLVEGGGVTIESFLRQKCVDEIELHVAPKVLGSGRAWADGMGVDRLEDAWQLTDMMCERLGNGFRINAKVLK